MLKEQKDAHLSRAMTMYGDYLLRVCNTYVQDIGQSLRTWFKTHLLTSFSGCLKHPLKEVKASGHNYAEA